MGWVQTAAVHYELACACSRSSTASRAAGQHIEALLGLAEAIFELAKGSRDLASSSANFDLNLFHQQLKKAEGCFRQALQLVNQVRSASASAVGAGSAIGSMSGEGLKLTLTESRELVWYNLSCIAALRQPLDEENERLCEKWLIKYTSSAKDNDEGVYTQLAADPDLCSLHQKSWFQKMLAIGGVALQSVDIGAAEEGVAGRSKRILG